MYVCFDGHKTEGKIDRGIELLKNQEAVKVVIFPNG